MAEFKKVMEEYRRMCKSFADESCDKCPLNTKEFGFCDDVESMDLDEFEDIVMTWSKENPPEIYPTLEDIFTDIINFYDTNLTTRDIQLFYDIYGNKQIPKELAEKFGILPINMCGLNKYVDESEWR